MLFFIYRGHAHKFVACVISATSLRRGALRRDSGRQVNGGCFLVADPVSKATEEPSLCPGLHVFLPAQTAWQISH